MQYKIILLLLGVCKHIRFNIPSHEVILESNACIPFIRLLLCIIFLGSDIYSFLFNIQLAFIYFLFVWVSGATPRVRYDKLLYLAGRRFLPF